MEKNEFLRYSGNYFKNYGFEKIGSRYYLNSNENVLLCEVYLQKSFGNECFYVNFCFFIGNFQKPYAIDRISMKTYTPFVDFRFYFPETGLWWCPYPEYDQARLFKAFDYNMQKFVFPALEHGRRYLLARFNISYYSILSDDRIIQALSEQN